MEIVAHTLIWNGEKYLPDLFASFDAQTLKEVGVRAADNGSTDGSVSYLREHHSQSLVVRNVRNLGFAGGHNQLFKFTLEKWAGQDMSNKAILIVNQDMILDPLLLEHLARALENDSSLGAVQPKIYRLFAPGGLEDEGVEQPVKSEILDTTGLRLKKSWRLEDRGAGELDKGQYDGKNDLIGPTGTLALFRASALLDVMADGEVFDDDFFAYREDCDLALRLRRRGWKTRFEPLAKAWHYRGMFGAGKRTWKQILQDRRGRRPFLAALSARNQLFSLMKNLTFGDILRASPFLFFDEGGRVVYSFFFERETRKMLLSSLPLFWKMLKKRRDVLSRAQVPAEVLRSYMKS